MKTLNCENFYNLFIAFETEEKDEINNKHKKFSLT